MNKQEVMNELKKALEIDKAMKTYEIEIIETKTITVPIQALSLEQAVDIAFNGFEWEQLDEQIPEIMVKPKGEDN